MSMVEEGPQDVTRLLRRARGGDAAAAESFWRLVYSELRSLAQAQLGGERTGHTLQPTALVHEAFLRLLGPGPLPFESRAHFFGAAARAMRRVLVDHARARRRVKRGGGRARGEGGGEPQVPPGTTVDLVALDEALERFSALDPRKARVVELRFFAGLTVGEIAKLLGVSAGTVSGDWKIAQMWLRRELGEDLA